MSKNITWDLQNLLLQSLKICLSDRLDVNVGVYATVPIHAQSPYIKIKSIRSHAITALQGGHIDFELAIFHQSENNKLLFDVYQAIQSNIQQMCELENQKQAIFDHVNVFIHSYTVAESIEEGAWSAICQIVAIASYASGCE